LEPAGIRILLAYSIGVYQVSTYLLATSSRTRPGPITGCATTALEEPPMTELYHNLRVWENNNAFPSNGASIRWLAAELF